MSARTSVLFALLFAFCANAWPQFRTIPEAAKRAHMSQVTGMVVSVDGTSVALAPGAQIRDRQNYIIVPTALPGDSLVSYTTDADGRVFRVWILTAEEADRPDQNVQNPPEWRFGTPIERLFRR